MILGPRVRHFADVEGCTDHFYLDTRGIVTIGLGCQVRDPTLLRMTIDGGHPASHEQILADYERVSRMKPGLKAGEYRIVTFCRMSDADVLELFDERWNQIRLELESHIGPITELPEAAQAAIMDMSFNMGVSRLFDPPPRGFPRFMAAFKAQDWAECARECAREGVAPSRNDWTRTQFASLEGTQ